MFPEPPRMSGEGCSELEGCRTGGIGRCISGFKERAEQGKGAGMISRRVRPQHPRSRSHTEIVAGGAADRLPRSFLAQGTVRPYLPQVAILNGRSRFRRFCLPVPKCERDGLSAPVY